MDTYDIKKLIFKLFKNRGFSLDYDATNALINVLSREEDIEGSLRLILDEIRERIDGQLILSTVIDVKTIESIVADLSANEEDLVHESLQVIDAFNSPKLYFDEKNKSFKVLNNFKGSTFSDVQSKANMYRERLLLTQQRLLRSEKFTLQGHKSSNPYSSKDVYDISSIDSLLGSNGKKVLLGFLTQPEENSWYLEDFNGMIRLDLSKTQYSPLFYTEGSIVIVQGEYRSGNASKLSTNINLHSDRIFYVEEIFLPPAEKRINSLKSIGLIGGEIFGEELLKSHHYERMKNMELSTEDQLVVIISEIHLDKPHVLNALKKVFEGFEANEITPLYVLIGNFFSKSYKKLINGKEIVNEGYQRLANLIKKFPKQRKESKFLIIPGPNDHVSSAIIFPQSNTNIYGIEPLISSTFIEHLRIGSNPCRIRCFTQELVIFRDDIYKKMNQNIVLPLHLPEPDVSSTQTQAKNEFSQLFDQDYDELFTPTQGGSRSNLSHSEEPVPEITQQLVGSILDQAHLSPLPAYVSPIIWDYDYTMRLFPLPHLLVLADSYSQFSYNYQDCNTVNPGIFSVDFSFVVYQPATESVQLSRVN